MPRDRDETSGRWTTTYTDEMVLDALGDDGATTSEVADSIGSERRLALRRLRELEEDGRVTAREVGNTFLWSESNE